MKKIAAFIRTDKFFYAVLIFFIFQATWITVSVIYPQPFDENTHLGLIKLYSQYWSPFLSEQPPNADVLGAVARDPSYLYHYLISFPYRIFAHFAHSLPAQIIFLRFINVAIFAASLVVFRKVLQKTKATPGIINCVFLFFVLIPVVSLLAGQINYDSLLMLTVAATLLLTLNFVEAIDKKRRVNLILGLGVISTVIISSLVKTEFLPIFVVVIAFIIFKLSRFWRLNKAAFIRSVRKEMASTRRGTVILSLILFIVAGGLFFQRYGVNFLRYGTPVPRCDQVLTIEQCSANGSWKRGYDAERTKQSVGPNPIRYSVSWVVRMFIYSFYTRSGGNPGAYYVNVNPLPLIGATAIAIFSSGILIFLF